MCDLDFLCHLCRDGVAGGLKTRQQISLIELGARVIVPTYVLAAHKNVWYCALLLQSCS